MEDVRHLLHTLDSDELRHLVTLLETSNMETFLSVLKEEIVDRESMNQRRDYDIRYESTLKKREIDYKQEYYSNY